MSQAAVTQLLDADAKFKAGDLDGAEAAYGSTAISECDDATIRQQAYNNRGALRIQRGDHAGAVADFEAALAINPKSADVWYNLGAAQRNAGLTAECLASFDKSSELRQGAPTFPCEVSRCEALSTLGRFAEAVSAGETCVKLEASKPTGHAALGFALLKTEAFQEAIEHFEAAQSLGDISEQTNELLALAHSARADAASHAGDFPLALESYEKALELMVSESLTVRYNFGVTLKNAGQSTRATAELERVVSEMPTHSEATYALAILKFQLGDFPGAKPLLQRAVALEPENADRRYNWGILLQNLGDVQGAVEAFRLVLAKDSGYDAAKRALAQAIEILALEEAAVKSAEEAAVSKAKKAAEAAEALRNVEVDAATNAAAVAAVVAAAERAALPPPAQSSWRPSMPLPAGVDLESVDGLIFATVSYAVLSSPPPFPEGIHAAHRERHLSDADFGAVFRTTLAEFEKLPKWKRDSKKKSLKLF
ncbi:hypothetical protein M885DRAFT_527040 [Pelagophyceae sp. CCMP2097]|nr:hypothetical protein M885DRAFT_527040 [Pelagophyceae sp. CCMP2097]